MSDTPAYNPNSDPNNRVPTLEEQFGGTWCSCIHKVIEELTPKKLAVYCIEKGYKEMHKPSEDELGIRYGYYLRTETQLTRVGDDELKKDINIAAAFGDFFQRDYESLKSVLIAIQKIATFEERFAQEVSEEVVGCDESKAPAVQATTPNRPDSPFAPNVTKRKIQTHQGLRPVND
jgi:hypothetical protein